MMKPEPEFDKFPGKPAHAPAPSGKYQRQVSHWRAPTAASSRVWPVEFLAVPAVSPYYVALKEPGEPRRHFAPPPPPTFQPHLPPASPPIRLTHPLSPPPCA